MSAAGRPASSFSVRPARSLTGSGQEIPRPDEMLHQRKEIREVLAPHPLLVKCENVASALGMDEIVGVLDALGDAFERGQCADGIAADEVRKLLVRDVGIDGHLKRRHFSQLARELEGNVFLRRGDGLDLRFEARPEGVDDLIDQNLRG